MKSLLAPLLSSKSRGLSRQPVMGDEQTSDQVSSPSAALQGNIAFIAIENIFQLFDFSGLTGKLVVQATNNSGSFFFRKGVLIHGLLRVSNRKIGQILVDAGLLSEAQLAESLRLHQENESQQRFGHYLLEQGYIAPERLEQSLLNQAKEAFFEVLTWKTGTFTFYPDQMPETEEVKLYARIDHLLLEGMIHIDQSTFKS